jgi:hypothetical protein
MRESARGRSSTPAAFTDDNEFADISTALAAWQKAGDERMFKLILSPEFGDRLDLQRLTRELMRSMEIDLHTGLEWAAVAHFNTEHPHVHIAVRGIRDNGASLQLSRDYIKHGIREAAEELCTLQLGYRTELDAAEAQRREIDAHRDTSLDRIIGRENLPIQNPGTGLKATHFTISRSPGDSHLQGWSRIQEQHVAARLMTLEKMGLAEPVGNSSWRVRRDFEAILRAMQRVNDRQKMLAAHGALLSDARLQLVIEDLRKLESLEGRVVLHGEEEVGREAGEPYVLLEGTDGKLHHVYYTPEIHYARGLGKLRTNSFIRLSRKFSADGHPELVSRPIDSWHKSSGLRGMGALSVTRHAGQNLVRGFCPDERLGTFVVHVQVFADSRFQFFHTAKNTATYAFIGDFCEPSLHQVDPGAVGGSEVQVKTGPLGEPLSNQRCLVSAVVVQHDVNVKIGRHIGLDGVQKPAEFLRTMATM